MQEVFAKLAQLDKKYPDLSNDTVYAQYIAERDALYAQMRSMKQGK